MLYALGASIESQKIGYALPRTDITESITSWVNKDDEQQIYLLLGPKGSGKSTIAHTIARQFNTIMRLGSSYCFSRSARDKQNTTNLFSTIARDLADHDPQYMKALWAAVKGKRALRETIDPLTQFNRFILTPANQMTYIGPVLVVIDGLEHSGSESARKDLLTALAEKGAELPRNFKLLVTCRPEEDICAAFEGKSHVIQKHLKHHTFVSPPTSGQNKASRPRFRPPTPPLSIPEFTPSLGADSSTSDSTTISDTSGSGSAVSAMFDTWDDDSDSTESPPSTSSSVDEPQPSKKKAVVQVTRRSQELITVEQISETGDRTVRRTNSDKLESWVVNDHPQSGLLLKEVATAEPASVLPPIVGLSGYDGGRLQRRYRKTQVRAKTLIRHSTNVGGAEILGRDDLASR
jgi:energy-coupling factor transporter ATP-binding protein EcfA2